MATKTKISIVGLILVLLGTSFAFSVNNDLEAASRKERRQKIAQMQKNRPKREKLWKSELSKEERKIQRQERKAKRLIDKNPSKRNKRRLERMGCTLVQDLEGAESYECPEAAGRYNTSYLQSSKFEEDEVLSILDTGANIQIGADQVWALGYTGVGETVAVLDTGVDASHPELSSSIVGGRSFVSYTSSFADDHGHGTHVAGIITADGVDPDAEGAAPNTSVWMGKVCNSSGNCFSSDIAAAIDYVVLGPDGVAGTGDEPAKIISISIGGGGTFGDDCDGEFLADKVNWAVDNGVTVIIAAGNSGGRVASPGCASKAIAVAAVNSGDTRPSWSGQGNALDISAPGVSIYSPLPDNDYDFWSGTSMATPHVTAVAALLRDAVPSITDSQIKSALYDTAVDLGSTGWDTDYGWGRVNAIAAVNAALEDPDPDPDPDTTPPTVSVSHDPLNPDDTDSVVIEATGSDLAALSTIEIYVDNDTTPVQTCGSSPCTYVGGPYTGNTDHTYFAIAEDEAGNTARDPETGNYEFSVSETDPGGGPDYFDDFDDQNATSWSQISAGGYLRSAPSEPNGELILDIFAWAGAVHASNPTFSNYTQTVDVTVPQGSNAFIISTGRVQNGNNMYLIGTWFGNNYLYKRVNGSWIFLKRTSTGFTPQVGVTYRTKLEFEDNNIRYKIWEVGDTEPGNWGLTATDNSFSEGEIALFGYNSLNLYDNLLIETDEGGGEEEDTTPPAISNVQISNITETSATITWNTDEPSDSTVNYGTTTSLGSTESDGTLTTSHSVTLNGLTANTEANTTYFFEVQSTDASNNEATDDNGGNYYQFTTTDDTAPIISNVQVTNITENSATISWTTDEASDSTVNFGTSTSLGETESDGTMTTNHSINITGLAALAEAQTNTTYFFEVRSEDASGNEAVDDNSGTYYQFTTTDETAPVISNVQISNITETSATVTWTTDEASDSTVNFGTTTSLGSTESDGTMTTNHSVNLSGLSPNTQYFLEVQSEDASNNQATDDNSGSYYSFTTDEEADTQEPNITNVQVSNITENSATITWDTDEPSNSTVNYGTTTSLGETESDGTLTTNHSVNITGLAALAGTQANTTYFFEVRSEDVSGNEAIDDNSGTYYQFTTTDETAPIISNVQISNITETSATVTWDTDEASDSTVNYGTSTSLGSTESDGTMTTSHSINLSSLSSGTTYFLEVVSTDGSANEATDDNGGGYYSFTTDEEDPGGGEETEYTDDFEDGDASDWSEVSAGGSHNQAPSESSGLLNINVNGWAGVMNTTIPELSDYTQTYDLQVPTGNSAFLAAVGRYRNSSNFYLVGTWFGSHYLYERVNGNWRYITRTSANLTPQVGVEYTNKLKFEGNTIYYKIWEKGTPEPGAWSLVATDNSHASGRVTLFGYNSRVEFDNLVVTDDTTTSSSSVENETDDIEEESTEEETSSAPVISNVLITEVGENSARVSWTTDQETVAVVKYGTYTPLSESIMIDEFETNHSVVLTDLLDNLQYFVQIEVANADGEQTTDDFDGNYYQFQTLAAPEEEVESGSGS